MENPDDKEYGKREALISLHIRIQNLKNGKIIHATNLTSKFSDLVEKTLVDRLASFHYTFFPYEYPIQEKRDEDSIQKKRTDDPLQKNGNGGPFQKLIESLFKK